MAGFSKDLIAFLLIITIIISLFGTLTAIYSITNGGYEKADVTPKNLNVAEGRVSLYLGESPAAEPSFASGQVNLTLK